MDKMDRRKKILLIDDNVNVLTVISDILKYSGFRVKTANTPQEALKLVSKESPDLVLIDLRMPDLDGIQLMYSIKERNPKIPVVIYSGYPSVETAKKAIKGGALDYIPKPFDVNELKLRITRIFKKC